MICTPHLFDILSQKK